MRKIIAAILVGFLAAGLFVSPAFAATVYAYAGARQDGLSATGVKTEALVTNPWLSGYEDHSLDEVTLQNTTDGHTLEIGIGRFNGNCGSFSTNVPRLFVYRWNAGVAGGYCDASYTAVSNTQGFARAMDMSAYVDQTVTLEIRKDDATGAWNFYMNGVNFGRYASTAFSPAFTVGNRSQAYGEVTSSSRAVTAMCTDNGKNAQALAAVGTGAAFFDIRYIVSGVTVIASMATNGSTLTDPTAWNAVVSSGGDDVWHGGPGYC